MRYSNYADVNFLNLKYKTRSSEAQTLRPLYNPPLHYQYPGGSEEVYYVQRKPTEFPPSSADGQRVLGV